MAADSSRPAAGRSWAPLDRALSVDGIGALTAGLVDPTARVLRALCFAPLCPAVAHLPLLFAELLGACVVERQGHAGSRGIITILANPSHLLSCNPGKSTQAKTALSELLIADPMVGVLHFSAGCCCSVHCG